MPQQQNPAPRVCIVCQAEKEQGIAICGEFICMDCERDIVVTDTADERYQFYLDCMKRIWDHALPR